MHTLILVRGLPGAGKSTLAETISDIHFEADNFFIENGEYKFDPKKLKQAHAYCLTCTKDALAYGWKTVAVSNTFVEEWTMEKYRELAQFYGYRFTTIVVENRHGNRSIHDVPRATVRRMRENFKVRL